MNQSRSLKEAACSTSTSLKEQDLASMSEDNNSNSSQDLELASSTDESEELGDRELTGTQKDPQNDLNSASPSQNWVDLKDEKPPLMLSAQNLGTVNVTGHSSKRKLTLSQPMCENDLRFGEPRFKRRATSSQPNMTGSTPGGSSSQPNMTGSTPGGCPCGCKNWYIEYKHQKQLVLKTQKALQRATDKLEKISAHLSELSPILN